MPVRVGAQVVGSLSMDAQAAERDAPSWLSRNRWRIGLALVAVAGGYWWHRAVRQQWINVGPVSERWLTEHAFDAGQHPQE